MKGPYERIKYDLRRLWECPVCQRRERAPGSITARLCLCQMQKADGKPVVMKLIEDGVQRTVPPVVLVHQPLEPLPPIVLPEYEPRERISEAEPNPSPPAPLPQGERGAGLEADALSARVERNTEAWPRSEADPSPPAPLPQEERGEELPPA